MRGLDKKILPGGKRHNMILAVLKYKLQTCGLNAFSVAAPTLWNKLPSHIRTSKSLNVFKKHVKTFLF